MTSRTWQKKPIADIWRNSGTVLVYLVMVCILLLSSSGYNVETGHVKRRSHFSLNIYRQTSLEQDSFQPKPLFDEKNPKIGYFLYGHNENLLIL